MPNYLVCKNSINGNKTYTLESTTSAGTSFIPVETYGYLPITPMMMTYDHVRVKYSGETFYIRESVSTTSSKTASIVVSQTVTNQGNRSSSYTYNLDSYVMGSTCVNTWSGTFDRFVWSGTGRSVHSTYGAVSDRNVTWWAWYTANSTRYNTWSYDTKSWCMLTSAPSGEVTFITSNAPIGYATANQGLTPIIVKSTTNNRTTWIYRGGFLDAKSLALWVPGVPVMNSGPYKYTISIPGQPQKVANWVHGEASGAYSPIIGQTRTYARLTTSASRTSDYTYTALVTASGSYSSTFTTSI